MKRYEFLNTYKDRYFLSKRLLFPKHFFAKKCEYLAAQGLEHVIFLMSVEIWVFVFASNFVSRFNLKLNITFFERVRHSDGVIWCIVPSPIAHKELVDFRLPTCYILFPRNLLLLWISPMSNPSIIFLGCQNVPCVPLNLYILFASAVFLRKHRIGSFYRSFIFVSEKLFSYTKKYLTAPCSISR